MASFFSPKESGFSDVVQRLLGDLSERLTAPLDTNAGSIARTLVEAFAREMALFYAMLERAHAAGYLDTAEGEALDNVVAVLGIKRARAGRLSGHVEFRRATGAPEDIGIPAGRRITGPPQGKNKGLPIFETTEDAVLPRGETRVLVAVQDVDDASGASSAEYSVIDPGKLTLMPRPILGIEQVTNPAPLRRHGADETDESLRARVKTALRDGAKGTLGAIAAAVKEQGVENVTVREPPGGPPGIVEVLIGDPDFQKRAGAEASVRKAIHEAKAAGIRVELSFAKTLYLQPELDVEPADENLDDEGFARLSLALTNDLARFVASLPVGVTMRRRKLEAVLYSSAAVRRIGAIKLNLFVDAAEGNQLEPGPTDREIGPEKDLRLDTMDTLVLDVARKPPLISRRRPSVFRLMLVVSIGSKDTRPRDEVRAALRAAVEIYAAQLAEAMEHASASEQVAIAWSPLGAVLKRKAGVRELQSASVVDALGLATAIDEDSPFPLPAAEVRVELGGVEITVSQEDVA